MQKAGGDAKKCLTWVGSREWTRQQAEAAAARDARVARMKQGHSSKKDAVTALAGIAASAIVPEDDSSLLDHLASSLDPFKDQALQRACVSCTTVLVSLCEFVICVCDCVL